MKELTIEEKAKAYDKTLERANSLLSDNQLGNAWIYKLLPELKDDDKEIRKELISMCQTLGKTEWIAWLEKQGDKQKLDGTFVNVDDVREDFVNEVYRVLDADSTNDRANQIIDAFDNLPTVTIEKQDEQSPIVDKVEPKFNVGNIIRHKEQGFTCKITGINIDTAEYEVSECSGIHLPFDFQDAYELVEQNPIECSEDNLPEFESYLCLMFQKFRIKYSTEGICTNGEIIDYVMEHAQKLKDILCHAWNEEDEARFESCIKLLQTSDGYDTINTKWFKSLKDKVKPNLNWSEEDELNLSEALHHIRMYNLADKADKLDKWLKSLKDRVCCEANCTTTKEWSEEDIMRIDNLIAIIENKGYPDYVEYLEKLKDRVQPQQKQQWSEEDERQYRAAIAICNSLGHTNTADWLKSHKLQKQWKPSDKQIYSLDRVLCFYGKGTAVYDSVKELLEQLKKLKE